MPVNRNLLETTKQTSEYQNGLAILGDPDDYAMQTMLAFVGFFYLLTHHEQGNIAGLDAFVQQLGVTPLHQEDGMQFRAESEEALTVAFVYLVGRNGKEFFENFLKLQRENPDGVIYSTESQNQ